MRKVRVDWYNDYREFHILDGSTGKCLHKSGVYQTCNLAEERLRDTLMRNRWDKIGVRVFDAK